MNINMILILKKIQKKYNIVFPNEWLEELILDDDIEFNFDQSCKTIDKLRLYIIDKYEIIYDKTPTNIEGIIKIIFDLSQKIIEVTETDTICLKKCKQCQWLNQCDIISIYCYIVTM